MKKPILFFALAFSAINLNAQLYLATHFDNDLLYIPANDDREYTHGQGVSVSWPQKPHMNRLHLFSLQLAVALYTPNNLRAKEPSRFDRPYASLLSLQTQWMQYQPQKGSLWTHRLKLGMLGLAFSSQFQIKAHAMTRNLRQSAEPYHPEGWPGQISAGGEPTLSWSSELRQSCLRNWLPEWIQLMTASRVEAGYQTRISQGFALRWGKLRSQSWLEVSQAVAALPHKDTEWFFYTQGGVYYQLYNAFLQGQFRPSVYTLSGHDLAPIVWEGEWGVAYRGQHFQTGYGLHFSTREYRFSKLTLHYWGLIYVGWAL